MKYVVGLLLCLTLNVSLRSQEKTLDFFIWRALSGSPLLKEFSNQQQSLALDSQIIRAALKPQVNIIGNNLYAPVIAGYGYDGAITNGAQVSAVVSVTKDFVSRKTLEARLNDLLIQQRIAANSGSITGQDIKKMVIDQYVTTYGEQLQLSFNTKINTLLASEDSLLRELTQKNVYRQSDYLIFAVTRQQQLLTVSQLRIQYEMDYATLNYLTGIIDTITASLQDPGLSLIEPGDLSASVFYRQFELDSLKLLNDKAIIDILYRPRFNAFADAGYNSSLLFQAYKNFGTSIGFGFSVPIYDGRQRQYQYGKIALQQRTLAGKRDFFLQQREQQILQLKKQLKSTEQLVDQINKQVQYTETLITVNEKLMATGDIRLQDFVLALNNYLGAKNLLTQNQVDRFRIINQLHYWDR